MTRRIDGKGLKTDAALARGYLARLGWDHAPAPSGETLAALQRSHLETVPFENLSVLAGEPIVLEQPAFVRKLVERKRGGFCYELNGAFAWLLARLGFAVQLLSARVYNRETERFGPDFDHMALLVHLERSYLVDVGFGDCARRPLALPDAMTTGVEGAYRVRARPGAHAIGARGRAVGETPTFCLEKQEATVWQPQFLFVRQAHPLQDFGPMCRYHAESSDSGFSRRLVCTLALPDGRVTLSADALTVTRDHCKVRLPIAAGHERTEILRTQFGIRGVDVATWQQPPAAPQPEVVHSNKKAPSGSSGGRC